MKMEGKIVTNIVIHLVRDMQGRIQEGGPAGVAAPPLKYKLIYISSQRNNGNTTSKDAMAFFFLGLHLILGGKLDDERREDLFFCWSSFDFGG